MSARQSHLGDTEDCESVPRPIAFPEEWWKWVAPKQRREVATRLADYTEERLQDLIQEVLTGVTVQGKDNKDATMEWATGSEFDFFMAQALANLDVFGSPDPDNPPRVKGQQIRVETTDNVPVRARPRRFDMIQQAFLEAKTNLMVRQHKLRDSHSD